MSKEIWEIGGIALSELLLRIKLISDKIVHSDFVFELYDSYPGTVWNGGRPTSTKPTLSLDDFMRNVEVLNRNGVGFNFTFSNLLLDEIHLDDERGNLLLERFHNGQNGVIAGSDVLAEYIRKTYPQYRLKNTLTHYRRDRDYYKRARDLYDILILPPALNNQFGFIEELGPERVEILVNETCHMNCPFSVEHYRKISEYNLSLGENASLLSELQSYCKKHHSQRLWPMSAEELRKNLIGTFTAPDEVDRLAELGVSRFKLRSRISIGGANDNIACDISTFIFNRLKSNEIKDMTHFFSTILSLNIREFKALR